MPVKMRVYREDQDCVSPDGREANVRQIFDDPDFEILRPGSVVNSFKTTINLKQDLKEPGFITIHRVRRSERVPSKGYTVQIDTTSGYLCVAVPFVYLRNRVVDLPVWILHYDDIQDIQQWFAAELHSIHMDYDVPARIEYTIYDLETRLIVEMDVWDGRARKDRHD